MYDPTAGAQAAGPKRWTRADVEEKNVTRPFSSAACFGWLRTQFARSRPQSDVDPGRLVPRARFCLSGQAGDRRSRVFAAAACDREPTEFRGRGEYRVQAR